MKTIALIVGHDIENQGASNYNGMTEFQYNDDLVARVSNLLMKHTSIQPLVIYRDEGDYEGLPARVNRTGVEAAIEFHCNAYNTKASGCETIFFFMSERAEKLANVIQKNMVLSLGNPDRGAKGVRAGRGYHLLKHTKMPCIITEPFFIDNDYDLKRGLDNMDPLALAIKDGIVEYFERV